MSAVEGADTTAVQRCDGCGNFTDVCDRYGCSEADETDPLRVALRAVPFDAPDVVFDALLAVLDEIDYWHGSSGRVGSIRQVIADALGVSP